MSVCLLPSAELSANTTGPQIPKFPFPHTFITFVYKHKNDS